MELWEGERGGVEEEGRWGEEGEREMIGGRKRGRVGGMETRASQGMHKGTGVESRALTLPHASTSIHISPYIEPYPSSLPPCDTSPIMGIPLDVISPAP